MAQFRKDTHQFLGDGKTIFEVVMLADQYGDIVGAANPSGMAVDAFGRARVSNPLTLFDSYHRYDPNGKFDTANTGGGTYAFSANAAVFSMNVNTANNALCYRESKRVFAYQPGKSLQILQTFILNEGKTGLRQRVGYFDERNGIFLELNGTNLSFVKRSNSTDTPVDIEVNQTDWNIDPLDGTGPSGYTLDITKAQIMFIDIEWLGLGSVRCGFVIEGKLIHCHSFHHANEVDGPYMTTACLPIRLEIKNIADTSSNSTLKQVCSSVISEGGYELRGRPRSIGRPASNTFTLSTADTWYPIASIRLKADQIDGIALPKSISALAEGNNGRAKYALIAGGTLGGNTNFYSVESGSPVEYNITASTITGGSILKQGVLGITNQASSGVNLDGDLFTYQLQRNGLTNTPEVLTLAMQSGTGGDTGIGSIDWEEVT